MLHRACILRLIAAALTLATPLAIAQDDDWATEPILIDQWLLDEPAPEPHAAPGRLSPSDRAKAARLEQRAVRAIKDGALETAEALLEQQRLIDPSSHVVYYNLACVHALMGLPEQAADMLAASIEHGFDDIHQLKRDPHLEAIRDQPMYHRVVENWPSILDARRAANLAGVESWLVSDYEKAADASLRITLLSAHDRTATRQSLDELGTLAHWAESNVFSEILEPELAAHDPWVVVVLPTPLDFKKWSVGVLGSAARSGFSQVGGAYLHDNKHLVAQDLGATLRHEFFHVLHWRDMTRRGQTHPIWIQEGLCSLVEDYDPAGSSIDPTPSWRTNIVKRLLDLGRLDTITKLSSYDQKDFSRRPLAKYAHARTVFLFLHDRGRLDDWYTAYTASFDHDPTGVKALETVFGTPVDQVEQDYRDWVRDLPMVPETGSDLRATLGVEIENGDGDGPVVVSLSVDASKRTGLRPGDRITGVEGAPTRDLNELIRRLGRFGPGSTVELSVRRGAARHETVRATLTAR